MIVSWFSAGVSSAVATWLLRDQIDRIIYIHIDDQHPDTERFLVDCEQWFGRPIERLQSPLKSVENACRQRAYVNGVRGASCTLMLKRRARKEWEVDHDDLTYVWGFDLAEQHRVDRLLQSMPEQQHLFPLVDNELTKQDTHGILAKAGITRPAMYDLGYPNNNCIGCVKGGKGYWNKIRRDFPEVFKQRAEMERLIGASCINGVYLDELDPKAGVTSKPILQDCGIYCEITAAATGGGEG